MRSNQFQEASARRRAIVMPLKSVFGLQVSFKKTKLRAPRIYGEEAPFLAIADDRSEGVFLLEVSSDIGKVFEGLLRSTSTTTFATPLPLHNNSAIQLVVFATTAAATLAFGSEREGRHPIELIQRFLNHRLCVSTQLRLVRAERGCRVQDLIKPSRKVIERVASSFIVHMVTYSPRFPLFPSVSPINTQTRTNINLIAIPNLIHQP